VRSHPGPSTFGSRRPSLVGLLDGTWLLRRAYPRTVARLVLLMLLMWLLGV